MSLLPPRFQDRLAAAPLGPVVKPEAKPVDLHVHDWRPVESSKDHVRCACGDVALREMVMPKEPDWPTGLGPGCVFGVDVGVDTSAVDASRGAFQIEMVRAMTAQIDLICNPPFAVDTDKLDSGYAQDLRDAWRADAGARLWARWDPAVPSNTPVAVDQSALSVFDFHVDSAAPGPVQISRPQRFGRDDLGVDHLSRHAQAQRSREMTDLMHAIAPLKPVNFDPVWDLAKHFNPADPFDCYRK